MKRIISITDIDDGYETTNISEIIDAMNDGLEYTVEYEEDGISDTCLLSELIGAAVLVGDTEVVVEG